MKKNKEYFEKSKTANKIDLKKLATQIPQNIPPMRDNQLFKLFEELMDEKFKLDKEYLAEGREPRVMVEYM